MTTLKIISILFLAFTIGLVSAQEAAPAVDTPAAAAPSPAQAAQPPQDAVPAAPSTQPKEKANIQATPVEATPKAEPAPTAQPVQPSTPKPSDIKYAEHEAQLQQKIGKIRDEVIKSISPDEQQLKDKLQEVVGSMTPEQRQAFELKMSTQARAAYEKYIKQTQLQNQKQQEEMQKLKEQTTFSKSDAILNAERQEFVKFDIKMAQNRSFTDLTFELPAQTSQDFRFALPVQQSIILFASTFANKDGVFSAVKDIEEDSPLWIYVYEDREKIVAQKQFYVQKIFNFQGKANSSYQIRVVNHGKPKLVKLHITNVLLQSNIRDKLYVEDVADHAGRIGTLRSQFMERMSQTRDKMMLKELNQKSLLLGLDHYYFYNIVEIVVLGIICVIQVESVRKLLMNNSVI